jgi:hypothetical protein
MGVSPDSLVPNDWERFQSTSMLDLPPERCPSRLSCPQCLRKFSEPDLPSKLFIGTLPLRRKVRFDDRAAARIRARFGPYPCTCAAQQLIRDGASRCMGKLGADLRIHRYTHCEQTPKVSPRPSRLQSNSEKRFGSSVYTVGVQVQSFASCLSKPPLAVSRMAALPSHWVAM